MSSKEPEKVVEQLVFKLTCFIFLLTKMRLKCVLHCSKMSNYLSAS